MKGTITKNADNPMNQSRLKYTITAKSAGKMHERVTHGFGLTFSLDDRAVRDY